MPFRSLSHKHFLNFLLLLLCIVIFFTLSKYVHIEEEGYKEFLADFPVVLSGIIFIVLYVVVTFFIWVGPKDLFRITAAVIYGAYVSTLLVWIAEMINAIVLFSLSRKLGRGFVESKLRGGMKRLDQTIAETRFWSIFWLRFMPIIPIRFLDLGFGLTRISLKKYFTICLVATPLRIFFLQFFLSLGIDTVMNPDRLQDYLTKNPRVMCISSIYLFFSIVMAFLLKRKTKKVEE